VYCIPSFRVLPVLCFAFASAWGAEVRPYEFVWADRTADETPELADLSDADAWTVVSTQATARLSQVNDRGLFRDSVGRLFWCGTNAEAAVSLRLKRPVTLTNAFDFASVWLWGDMKKGAKDPAHPPLIVTVDFEDVRGRPFSTDRCRVEHREWLVMSQSWGLAVSKG